MHPDELVFHALKPRNTVVFVGTISACIGIALTHPLFLMIAAICLSALVISGFEAWGLLSNVRVQRRHLPRAFQHNSVGVELTVTCEDRKEPEFVLLEDTFPPATPSRIRRLIENPLRRGEMLDIQFFGTCEHRRGIYVLGPVRLEAFDALGFFRREVFVDEFTQLVVYPEAVDLTQTDLLGEGTLAHVGLDTTRRAGVSEEFLGIREYRQGDSQRIIHWKSTARHGELMVKEFQEEMTTTVFFFLDLGRLGLVGIGDQTSVEYGIKSCASMAKRAVERGHRVGLYAIGEKVEHIGAGSGVAHLLTILDRLALLRAEGDSGFLVVAADLVDTLPPGATAVLILGATTIDLEHMRPLLARLIDRHVLPIVTLIDDRAFIKVYREQEERHFKAVPIDEMVRQLRLMGARVHVVRRAKSMEQALLQGLERESA